MNTEIAHTPRNTERNSIPAHRVEHVTADSVGVERARRLSRDQEWSTIERDLPNAGTVTLTPANEAFACAFGGERFLGYGTTGAASELVKTSLGDLPARLVNLWHSAYESPDGAVSIGFLRSGTVARYGERNAELRQAANDAGAAELMEAAALVAARNGARGKLSLLSIDLQTPRGKEGELEVEWETVAEQRAALEQAAAQGVVLAGERVPVSLTALVFPTHEGSYTRKEEWKLSAETIAASREIATCSLDSAPAPLRAALGETVREIESLLAKEERNESTPPERFALAARVVLLSSLTGDIAQFGCRSGKDRTGFLDVEVKFAAYQLARRAAGEAVSEPGDRVLPEERAAWKEILLQGGNIEIQKLNTGYPGSKLDHGFLLRRVGPELWSEFVGESRKSRA